MSIAGSLGRSLTRFLFNQQKDIDSKSKLWPDSNLQGWQIKHGFWYFFPEINWPPKQIFSFAEYDNQEKLNIGLKPIGISKTERKKLKEAWMRQFSSMKHLKFLWVLSRIDKEFFDAICSIPNLEGLYLKHSPI